MMLLVIEHEAGATPFLTELCRGSAHRVIAFRDVDEAAGIYRRAAEEIDWIILNGIPADREDELVRTLRETGCQAPIVHLSACASAQSWKNERIRLPRQPRLTRLDIHRILTQAGGPFEHGETLFEYHAPHPVKSEEVPVRRKRGGPVRSDSFSHKRIKVK